MWLYEKLQIKPEKDGPMEKNIFKREEIVSVLTDQPINEGLLSYLVPIDFISVGQFVEIPIGSRSCVGVVWGSSSIKLDSNRLLFRLHFRLLFDWSLFLTLVYFLHFD